MVGLDGAWKLVVACALGVGCQRLEVVSEESGGNVDDGGSSSESGDEGPGGATTVATSSSGSGSGSGSGSADGGAPDPDPTVWCAYAGLCECYGNGKQLCDVAMGRIGCGYLPECEALIGRARESCVVGYYCQDGGTLDGTDVLCNDVPRDCAGTCDLDPTACDPDGDGVLTFSCGPGDAQCGLDQFCVSTADVWSCDSGGISDGDWLCADVPADCGGETLDEERQCLLEDWCVIQYADFTGRQITCEDDECHG